MDLPAESLHNVLLEVGLPSSVAELKNPTEEFVINLVTQFLDKMNFDVNAIRNFQHETAGQLSTEPDEGIEYIDELINLTAAMNAVGRKIFMKEFILTDLTAPAPKRTRNHASLMANFLLYMASKNVEIEERVAADRAKNEQLQALRKQRMEIKEAKNAEALQIAKNLEIKEQLESELANLKTGQKARRAKIKEAQTRLNEVEKQKEEARQHHANLYAQSTQIKEKKKKAASKIVKSPDRHNKLLQDLTKQKEEMVEERTAMEEALKNKKAAMEHIELATNFVRQQHAKFHEITEISKRFTEVKKMIEDGEKRIGVLNNLVDHELNVGEKVRNSVNTERDKELKTQWMERHAVLRNERKKLLEEKKKLEKTLEDRKNRVREILSQKLEIEKATAVKKIDCEKLIEDCRKLFEEEISEEQGLEEDLKMKLKTLGLEMFDNSKK